jgi:hypothetical protein
MKATELRIGNWVQIVEAGKEYQVEQYNFCTDDDGYSAFLDHITPIPLTEEWLLKFGFYEKYKSVHSQWSIAGFSIQQASNWDDDNNLIPTRQEFHYDWKFKVKWVHQLQNLYFELTGEELIIK